MNIPRSEVLRRYGYVFVVLIALMGCVPVALAQDWMPDANLRTEVRADLGLADNEELTQASMLNLTSLHAAQSNINNLTGLEFATNLTTLVALQNDITSLEPIKDLTTLTEIRIGNNDISDLQPLAGLTALTKLSLRRNNISDVSALSGLVNLTWLRLARNPVTDFSPLSGLKANITDVDITIPDPDTTRPTVSITVPSGAQNGAFDATITFTESISNFVQGDVSLSGTATASITDWNTTDDTVYTATITPTTSGTVILDIAADVATDAANNGNTAASSQSVTVDVDAPTVVIDVPSGTQNGVFNATITFSEVVSDFVQSDLSLGGTATASITHWSTTDNTVFTAEITPTTSGTVTLDVAADIATDAANNNNTAALTQTVPVDVDAPTIDVDRPGVTIFMESYNTSGYGAPISPVVSGRRFVLSVFFTEPVRRDEFDPMSELTFSGPTITITLAWGDGCSEVTVDEQTIRLCDQWVYFVAVTASGELTFNIAEGVTRDLAGNSNTAATLTVTADIDPPAISRVTVPSGTQGGAFNMTIEFTEPVSPDNNSKTFWISDLTISSPTGLSYSVTFQNERVDRITYILTLTPDDGRWSMDGQIRITAISSDAVKDAARNSNLQQSLSESVSPYVSVSRYNAYDMDKDDDVDIDDVRLVVNALGESGNSITNSRTDVDKDDDVDIDDLIAVINNFDDAAAPPSADIFTGLSPDALKALDPILLTETLDAVRLESDGSLKYLQAIVLLEHLLAEMRPDETQLLANYPNPFNPETWIPYHLAKSSDVRITIYDVRGSVVRRLELGHQREGYYTNRSRAAYWDGRNAVGERVASGIYFYQFQADNRSLLGKMLILK
jgi:hypothetical protein